MTVPRRLPISDQRQTLRLRLLAQRQLIEQRLAPLVQKKYPRYPRSMTMRFLTRQGPAVARVLLAGLTRASLFKSLATALIMAKLVRSISKSRTR